VAKFGARKCQRKKQKLTVRMVEAFDTPHMSTPSHRAHYQHISSSDMGKGVRAVVDIAKGTLVRGLSYRGKVLHRLTRGMCLMHVRQVHVDGEEWSMYIDGKNGREGLLFFGGVFSSSPDRPRSAQLPSLAQGSSVP
jgi:hypothetical protein